MAVPVSTKPRNSSDVFIREGMDREFDTESVAVTNGAAFAILLAAGQPMTAAAPTVAASVAAMDGMVLEPTWLAPSEVKKVPIIRKFAGLVVNQSALPLTDVSSAAGVTWTGGVAAISTAIALLGAVSKPEPTNQELQSL